MAGSPFVHVEIPADDPTAASKFYADVFGWEQHYESQVDYHMFNTGAGPGGGFVKTGDNMGQTTKPGNVLVYIGSQDIEADLAKIEAHGGKTIQPKMEIPGNGWLAVFLDPTGNRIGLYQGLPQ
jgi:predicted enzyme related to lactoylglutathione lyase